jgi:hypothetical protein
MGRRLIGFTIQTAILAGLSLSLALAQAQTRGLAKLPNLKPGWVKKKPSALTNDSYLNETQFMGIEAKPLGLDHDQLSLFDPNQTNELRPQFDSMNRDYELKKQYGLAYTAWLMTPAHKLRIRRTSRKGSATVFKTVPPGCTPSVWRRRYAKIRI